MRRVFGSALAFAAVMFVPTVTLAQAGMEADRVVAGGGITVTGWAGLADAPRGGGARPAVTTAMLAPAANGMRVVTGPAITYWNPANRATGDYTVKATFLEGKFQELNNHPHPYGIMIGGNDLGTDNQSLLYCAAYGNGTFIFRGFGPAAFQLGGARPIANAAVNKAAAVGQPVQQEIAVSVRGDNVSCSINGTVVATHPKSEVVGAGKLKSTDGVYGIRFAHNTEALVTGLTITKP